MSRRERGVHTGALPPSIGARGHGFLLALGLEWLRQQGMGGEALGKRSSPQQHRQQDAKARSVGAAVWLAVPGREGCWVLCVSSGMLPLLAGLFRAVGRGHPGCHSMLSGCSQAAFLSPLHPSLAAPSPGEDKLGVSEVGEGSMKQRKERGCGSGRPEFKSSRTSLGVSEELPVPLGYQRCQPCILGRCRAPPAPGQVCAAQADRTVLPRLCFAGRSRTETRAAQTHRQLAFECFLSPRLEPRFCP